MVYIPGPLLRASVQREDGASMAIYNPGCRQDSSALRQACPWREQAMGWGGTRKEAGIGGGGGVKLRQGEWNLDRKQGERWGKWKDLCPPKDWRRSSRGWREALPVAGIPQQGRQGLGTRRTCWLCSSVRAEYDLGLEEKSTKMGPGKLEKERTGQHRRPACALGRGLQNSSGPG